MFPVNSNNDGQAAFLRTVPNFHKIPLFAGIADEDSAFAHLLPLTSIYHRLVC